MAARKSRKFLSGLIALIRFASIVSDVWIDWGHDT